ncbi:MAG TPA: hypothetical protein VM779_12385 [Thermoanaerobaculia bacterium]|nr:hypothetical protein [Thermoanaerobaculia bacterium]
MIGTLLLSASVLFPLRPAAEVVPPPRDLRDFKNVVARGDGFDVYWTRNNQLVSPLLHKALRTSVAVDGAQVGPTVVLREADWQTLLGVSAGHGPPLVSWYRSSANPILFASPVADNKLKYPMGKQVADRMHDPDIVCDAATCAALWWVGANRRFAVYLDQDANVLQEPFELPEPSLLYAAGVDGRGLILVHNDQGEHRATRFGFDGEMAWDHLLLKGDQRHSARVALFTDSLRDVIAIVDVEREPEKVRLVTTAADGRLHDLGTIFAAPEAAIVHAIALGWNGERYLLAGAYHTPPSSVTSFALELDGSFRPLRMTEIPGPLLTAVSVIAANGDAFAVGGRHPYVTIYRNGHLTEPLILEEEAPPPRRRSVGR